MVQVRAGMRIRSQEGARDLPPMTNVQAPENVHGR
jgi:hypothetical protein